jgi:L-ribulose-5-phosphate 3-epimerase
VTSSEPDAPPIHCMQGRLLPPQGDRIQAFPEVDWPREFELGRTAEIQGIEWIYEDSGSSQNPLGTDEGIARMTALAREHGVAVESVCADWFIDRPLLADPPAGLERLRWLLSRASAAGIRRIVVPFVDASAVDEDDIAELAALISEVTPDLERTAIELHLETPLAPDAFARLLESLDARFVKANYDSGNSASLGYDPRDEFEAYGDRIGSVHVKDRLRGGTTVPLGGGDADIELVLSLLRRHTWERPLVLQVARGAAGDEAEKIKADVHVVRALWDRCGERAWT